MDKQLLLVDKMIAWADANDLPADDKMRVLAKELNDTPPGNVPSLLGRWARARRHWCDVTGDELV